MKVLPEDNIMPDLLAFTVLKASQISEVTAQ